MLLPELLCCRSLNAQIGFAVTDRLASLGFVVTTTRLKKLRKHSGVRFRVAKLSLQGRAIVGKTARYQSH